VSGTAGAQSVRGRVVEAETGAGVRGARVVLHDGTGRVVAQTATAADGAFLLAAREAGRHRLEVLHAEYRTTTTDEFTIGAAEEVVVDVRLATQVIALEPLTITARRRDPRHEPTHEGFYTRYQLLPQIGNARAISRNDGEMINARDARDVLPWLAPPYCLVVYWNGHLQDVGWLAELRLETHAIDLEGVEYYRYIQDAPQTMRDLPGYLLDCTRHSVLALWTRTGHFGEAPAAAPSRSRLMAGGAVYHLGGSGAPGLGGGIEATLHWPATRRIAIGLHTRRSVHRMPAEAVEDLLPETTQWPFAVPTRNRPFALWVAGLDARLTLPRAGPLRPVVAARAQVARRTLSLESNSAGVPDVPIHSWGSAFGASVGAEMLLRDRFAVQAAVGHERLFFGPYGELERDHNRTAARWHGTQLRFGIGYSLQR
jgi:hypothetical protein